MHLVTVATFSDLPSAQVGTAAVRAAGIEAYLQGENFAQVNVFAIGFQGGLRLMVAEEDAEAAREILAPQHEIDPDALNWQEHPEVLSAIPVAAMAALAGEGGIGLARREQPVSAARRVGQGVILFAVLAPFVLILSTCIHL